MKTTNKSEFFEKFRRMDSNDGYEDLSKIRKSEVWKYYHFNKTLQKAKCLKCTTTTKILKATGGSTKGLIDHLFAEHKIEIKKPENPLMSPPSKKQKVTDYFSAQQRMSLERKVSRLCALSCLSFKKLATDVDIREALKAQNYELPKNWNHIKNLVLKEYNHVVDEVKDVLKTKKDKKVRFSITTDEYTSVKNRRYVNINCHHQRNFNSLGVPRAYGTMPAEKQVVVICDRLEKYGLEYSKDIIAFTTDGASVMKKMGELLKEKYGIEHQICLAHTIHLVVGDIFYKGKEKEATENQVEINVSLNQAIAEEVNDYDDEDEDEDDDELGDFQVFDDSQERVQLKPEYKTLIGKVRRYVKLFKKSPVKNDDNLQVHVREEKGKELSLILDCRTRWNTMLDMLKRFYEMRNSVKHALIDLNESFDLTETDLEKINEIIEALKPVKLAVQKLCKRECTLVQAERVLELTMIALSKQTTDIAEQIYEGFVQRVIKRRNSKMIHLMEYLSDPEFFKKKRKDSFGIRVDENEVKKKAIALIKRLFYSIESPDVEAESEENEPEIEEDHLSLEQQYEAVFQEKNTMNSVNLTEKNPRDFAKVLKHEMSAYEQSGQRSENLENLYQAMLTIPPTSVESERAFSAVGLFVTKLRSSLGDSTLDALLTLRSHYKSMEN